MGTKYLKAIFFAAIIFSHKPGFAQSTSSQESLASELLKEQCAFAGGAQLGFCSCLITSEDEVKTAESVLKAVTTKKITSKNLMIINPFVQTCPGSNVKLGSETVVRLTLISWFVSESLKANENLQSELEALHALGLLDIDKILGYMQSQSVKNEIKNKIKDLKNKEKWTGKAVKDNLTSSGKDKLKSAAYDELSEMVGFDVELTQEIISKLYPMMKQEALAGGFKNVSGRFARENVQALVSKGWSHAKTIATNAVGHAKGSVYGLARGALIETTALVTGYNLSFLDYFDPITLLTYAVSPTPARAGTLDVIIAENPLLFLTTNFYDSGRPEFRNVAQGVDLISALGDSSSMAKYSSQVVSMASYLSKRKTVSEGKTSLLDAFWVENQ